MRASVEAQDLRLGGESDLVNWCNLFASECGMNTEQLAVIEDEVWLCSHLLQI